MTIYNSSFQDIQQPLPASEGIAHINGTKTHIEAKTYTKNNNIINYPSNPTKQMMPSKRRATLIACQVPLINHRVRIYGKQAPQSSLTYWHHFGRFGAPCGSPLPFPHQPNPNDQALLTCNEALASWTETLEESFSCTIDVCRAVKTGDPYKLKSFPQNICQAP